MVSRGPEPVPSGPLACPPSPAASRARRTLALGTRERRGAPGPEGAKRRGNGRPRRRAAPDEAESSRARPRGVHGACPRNEAGMRSRPESAGNCAALACAGSAPRRLKPGAVTTLGGDTPSRLVATYLHAGDPRGSVREVPAGRSSHPSEGRNRPRSVGQDARGRDRHFSLDLGKEPIECQWFDRTQMA
jgi:hypothetical protein